MLRREKFEDFDIYSELIELRLKADASSVGNAKYRETLRFLGRYAAVNGEARESVARGEAQRAEDRFIHEWRRGQHRYSFGRGVGVRALLASYLAERLVEKFVPDPPQLGAPEVVEVEHPDIDEVLTGLILPEGAYYYDQPSRSSGSGHLQLYAHARQMGGRAVGHSSPEISLMPFYVISVSDSAGAFWQPPAMR
jgi:hypothetical protein